MHETVRASYPQMEAARGRLLEWLHHRVHRLGSNTHGGELCIIFLTVPCGERVNTGLAYACPAEMMQD